MSDVEMNIGITFNAEKFQATSFHNLPPEDKQHICSFLLTCYKWATEEMIHECIDLAGAKIKLIEPSAFCQLGWIQIQSEGLKYKNNREHIVHSVRTKFNEQPFGGRRRPIYLTVFYNDERQDLYL